MAWKWMDNVVTKDVVGIDADDDRMLAIVCCWLLLTNLLLMIL
jgi:hypothetical protein